MLRQDGRDDRDGLVPPGGRRELRQDALEELRREPAGAEVRVGDAVAAGQALIVIEAMKMENELKAVAPGTVRDVRVAAGQAVNAGDVLVVIGA